MELFIIFLPLLLLLLIFLYSQTTSKKPSPNPKTNFKPYPFLGHIPHLVKHRHESLEWISTLLSESPTHSLVFKVPFESDTFITSNPANIEHMIKSNFSNYPKGHQHITLLEDFLGHGIFNSDGDHWNWQRKAASYEFNKKSLRNFIINTVKQEIVHRLLPLATKKCNSGEVFDLQEVFERLSFDNICKVAFGEDPCCLTDDTSRLQLVRAFGDASHIAVARFNSTLIPFTWRIKKLLNLGSEKRLKECIKIINDFAMNIIKSRRESEQEDDDLLSRFASNKDNSDQYLRDIVVSFLVAGLETTSSGLTWFFWILSTRPDVEEKILKELSKIRSQRNSYGDNYDTFTFDELREMHYLHAAISESLRLYPPVPFDTQSCLEDDVMPDGALIRKGWFVTYCAYSVGRLRDVWGEDCMEYRPERWLEDGVFKPENPFKFPVFHAGPRMCLGKEMAYIQMKSAVACLIERFRIEALVDKDKHPEMVRWLTIRMKDGLPVLLREREKREGVE
ncbi:Cytochrome P450 E-class group I protein [Dioscorea alata]|uniref:Cytochrome P450 E-class group I protein n=1 Tax=Dioscorea alata TaxID=55571 RepID=A0ACB7VWA8_DIOAL|nr:Cytochrome P450 E-class group I protein [Dioscorea alata]